jgi:hypothetical protein
MQKGLRSRKTQVCAAMLQGRGKNTHKFGDYSQKGFALFDVARSNAGLHQSSSLGIISNSLRIQPR